ncbi:MAG: LLM class flavin-dependent oxidoreductase [Candidatus Thorarchaeota archaeon]
MNGAAGPDRIGRLRESIQLIKTLWTEHSVTFEGKYYQTLSASANPMPVRRPHPPIIVGGRSRAIMDVATDLADGWAPYLLDPDGLSVRIEYVKTRLRDIGRPLGDSEIIYGADLCAVSEDPQDVNRLCQVISYLSGIPVDMLPNIVGTPDQIIRRVETLCEVGVTSLLVGFVELPTMSLSLDSIRLFGSDVIPSFRS